MHRVERSVLVPYSAEQMFTLVAAVDEYPDFLPWCAGAKSHQNADGTLQVTIELVYHGVSARFTTRNRNLPPKSIRMHLIEGPFRRLDGEWTFRQLRDDACKVHLSLHYQFASGLLGRLIAPVFEGIAVSLIDSFTRRAEALYEEGS
ncbi:MAG TPA: type II toxin-antitoxin system RatA family toxin [Burkholderiaceae bacterium]|nr:type II toxin-antitoxin system RatA family toxin [Burkholderiaceae bacterium]